MTATVDTARELTALVSRLRRRLREVAGFEGLTPSQTSVLSQLERRGPASTSDLARVERVRPQSMAATVAALESLGYVTRHPDPDDGRRQLVALDDDAGRRIETSRQRRREWLATVLDDQLTGEERRTVAAAVAILMRVIDE